MDEKLESAIRAAVAAAVREIGLPTIKSGPFFGLGERAAGTCQRDLDRAA